MTHIGLAVLLVVTGCEGCEQASRWTEQSGRVVDVRLRSEVFSEPRVTDSSSGAVGALAGGVVAGPVGAVIGYALDHDPGATATVTGRRLAACQFVVELDRGPTVTFFTDYPPEFVQRCSMLRQGDTTKVWVETASNRPGMGKCGTWYKWPQSVKRYRCLEGTVVKEARP